MNMSFVPDRPGVALLIDGENLSSDHAGRLITLACSLGPLIVKRVYGNVPQLKTWTSAPGFRVIHSGCGKNAADILLAIDAVDLAHEGRVGTFVLASSDRDFSHIAHRLREAGLSVHGVGEEKTHEVYRKACSTFHALKSPVTTSAKASLSQLDQQIHAVIKDGSGGMRTMTIATLANQMRNRHDVKLAQIKIGEKSASTWREYLNSKDHLYKCDPKGPDARVTLLT